MRSSKAPPNQKNRGQVLPTPPNLASEPHKCNARRGFLGTSAPKEPNKGGSGPLGAPSVHRRLWEGRAVGTGSGQGGCGLARPRVGRHPGEFEVADSM